MIKFLLLCLVFLPTLNADKILNKSLACPTMDSLQKAPLGDDYLNLNMYAIAHGCEILYRDAQIHVIGYDPRNTQTIYLEVVNKKTGKKLFIKKSQVQIEQGGKKANYRF